MFYFIVNPKAGMGRGERTFNKLKKSRIFKATKNKFVYTKYKGHAEIFARFIASKETLPQCVIVVGGDGTLHEVVNGLGDSGVAVAFIPGGSGNDFARGVFIKGRPVTLLKRIVNHYSPIRPYWNGSYHIDGQSERQFVNSMGFGFDAEIAHYASALSQRKRWRVLPFTSLTYVFALLSILFRFRPVELTLKLDGIKRVIPDCWMVTIANHPYYGGGMKIIPHAKIQPDILPILVIHSISKWKILAMFMTVFTGKHLAFKEVECFEASTVEINTPSTIRYQVDGQTGTCHHGQIWKNHEPMTIQGHNQ